MIFQINQNNPDIIMQFPSSRPLQKIFINSISFILSDLAAVFEHRLIILFTPPLYLLYFNIQHQTQFINLTKPKLHHIPPSKTYLFS